MGNITPVTIVVKSDKVVFEGCWSGKMTCNIRRNDRNYAVGDALIQRETVYTGEQMAAGKPLEYTGREITSVVKHILFGPFYGLPADNIILSLEHLLWVDNTKEGRAVRAFIKGEIAEALKPWLRQED